jgi:hypothetical protein
MSIELLRARNSLRGMTAGEPKQSRGSTLWNSVQ